MNSDLLIKRIYSKKTIKNIWNALFMLLAFALIYFFKVQSVWIIIAALVIGCLLTLYRQKKKARAISDAASKEAE